MISEKNKQTKKKSRRENYFLFFFSIADWILTYRIGIDYINVYIFFFFKKKNKIGIMFMIDLHFRTTKFHRILKKQINKQLIIIKKTSNYSGRNSCMEFFWYSLIVIVFSKKLLIYITTVYFYLFFSFLWT